ncbi:MAG: DUF1445 domain-containing protein, partial [Burkholderiales bacterium]
MHTDLPIYADPRALREAVRAGKFRHQTSGQAPGYAQANLAILPARYAADFLRFCQLNPKPCPIIGMTEPGDPRVPSLGDVDLRTDIPRYRVFRNGELVDELDDVNAIWRDDLVGFAIGCSFSFEAALIDDGIRLRHIEEGKGVAMFKTNIATTPAGPFHGPTVVSM